MKKVLLTTLAVATTATVLSAAGADIYKKCAACHGATAATVYAGKVPALNTLSAEDLTAKLKEYASGAGNHFGMGPVMQAQAKMNLKSDEDIAAVVEHIGTLK